MYQHYDPCNHKEEYVFPICMNVTPVMLPCSYTSLHVSASGLTNDYFYLFMTVYLQEEFEAACKTD